MTPARENYARKRIDRLTLKIDRINNAIAARAHSGHPADIIAREQLVRDRNSSTAAIKRWQKELRAAGIINW